LSGNEKIQQDPAKMNVGNGTYFYLGERNDESKEFLVEERKLLRRNCDSPRLRGEIDGFLQDEKHKWVTLRHLCTNCRVCWVGRVRPARCPNLLRRFFFGTGHDCPHLDEIPVWGTG
jgi:hypothetical protein